MNTYKAICLVSGGLDSATALALALAKHDRDVLALSIYYGQKHGNELSYAGKLCQYYKINHETLVVPDVFTGGGSALVDTDVAVPDTTYEDIAKSGGVDGTGRSPTYVPFRNGNLISIATARAVVYGAKELWVGMHADDASNNAYADCTPEFLGAMANAVAVGTYQQVRLIVPFMWTEKSEIVRQGTLIGVPYHMTWSCYKGGEKACGTCSTCRARLDAFKANGFPDPIPYEGVPSW